MVSEMNAAHDEPSLLDQSSMKETVELAAKLIAGLVVTCYACGLIAINAYLAQFGFTDFSVLRPKSIFTGCWVLAVMLICILPFAGSSRRLPRPKPGKRGAALLISAGSYLGRVNTISI